MGAGYSANYADVIEESFIEEVAPNELAKFKKALEDEEVDFDDFASRLYDLTDFTDINDEVYGAMEELQSQFEDVTGLKLDLNYHNSEDEGSRYDDIEGAFWSVRGVYTLTPAGQKYLDKIQRCHYVIFG